MKKPGIFAMGAVAIIVVAVILLRDPGTPSQDSAGNTAERNPASDRTQPTASKPLPSAVPSPSSRPIPATAPSPMRPDEPGLESFLRSRHPGPWTLQKPENQDRIMSIHGGLIAGAGKTGESALELARTVARHLGVHPEQIDPATLKTDTGPRTTSYDFLQSSQGYEVFDGRLTILSRNDGAVYMINSDLRTPDPVETEILYSAADVLRVLQEKYSGREARITQAGKDPVIWADSRPHELAWHFSVEIPPPDPDRLQVLVSVRTARVLLERSTLLH